MGEVFVGHDWAEDHHDIHVQDGDGRQLAKARLADGVEGIAKFHALLAEHVEDPAEVVIASETDRGLFVAALIAAGYQVYAVNPASTAKYRTRHSTSGAKSDPGDAKVLADLARADRHNHRPVAGDSELSEAIKTLARAQQSLVWTRQRQTNQLRSTLREFYPAALEAFPDLTSSDAIAVLRIASTPEQGRRLSRSKIAAALRRGGRQRNIDKRTEEIQTALCAEQLEAPAQVADAMGTLVSSLVPVIDTLQTQIGLLETQLGEHFEAHPDAKIIRSLPGLGMILGARVLAEFGDDRTATTMRSVARTMPARHPSPKHPANTASCSPATPATSGSLMPATSGRSPRSPQAPAPGPSTTNDVPPATPTTARFVRSATGSSASFTAASATKPSTTNTPPGHTARPSPLDIYDRGISSRSRPPTGGASHSRPPARQASPPCSYGYDPSRRECHEEMCVSQQPPRLSGIPSGGADRSRFAIERTYEGQAHSGRRTWSNTCRSCRLDVTSPGLRIGNNEPECDTEPPAARDRPRKGRRPCG